MPKTREQKKQIVKDLLLLINKAKSIIFVDYRGLNVKEITSLRKKLKKEEADFRVIKNTYVKLALEKSKKQEAGKIKILEEKGPKAIVLGYGDEAAPAKNLYLFSREHKALKMLAGILDKKELLREEILSLALIPPRAQLFSQVVGSFGAPISGLVNALCSTQRDLVYVLQALIKSKS